MCGKFNKMECVELETTTQISSTTIYVLSNKSSMSFMYSFNYYQVSCLSMKSTNFQLSVVSTCQIWPLSLVIRPDCVRVTYLSGIHLLSSSYTCPAPEQNTKADDLSRAQLYKMINGSQTQKEHEKKHINVGIADSLCLTIFVNYYAVRTGCITLCILVSPYSIGMQLPYITCDSIHVVCTLSYYSYSTSHLEILGWSVCVVNSARVGGNCTPDGLASLYVIMTAYWETHHRVL